ncbi:hypothetical protein AV530_007958 [Patagioenas fasciata monilis]|uniref:Uncharacterized protein n=1 Tax=Patagioenas fasciata monilis TaxID=372326 RepID=A0A1V4KU52_PATFA|nr:hypothetical protein AV530_007958 [Patagioenas fasciata monilis]
MLQVAKGACRYRVLIKKEAHAILQKNMKVNTGDLSHTAPVRVTVHARHDCSCQLEIIETEGTCRPGAPEKFLTFTEFAGTPVHLPTEHGWVHSRWLSKKINIQLRMLSRSP